MLRPIPPGEVLVNEFLMPNNMTINSLEWLLEMTAGEVYDLITDRRKIDEIVALRLSKAFGTSYEFWIRLQVHYDQQMETYNLQKSS